MKSLGPIRCLKLSTYVSLCRIGGLDRYPAGERLWNWKALQPALEAAESLCCICWERSHLFCSSQKIFADYCCVLHPVDREVDDGGDSEGWECILLNNSTLGLGKRTDAFNSVCLQARYIKNISETEFDEFFWKCTEYLQNYPTGESNSESLFLLLR